MNVIDAIKSGKRFRRKGPLGCQEAKWFLAEKDTGSYYMELTVNDVLADDWEIEEQKITITKDDFSRAYNLARESIDQRFQSAYYPSEYSLAKELGFK